MAQEKFLTIREAAHYLNITEKEIINLAEEGKLPAYKIGGVYLRFKRDQLDKMKSQVEHKQDYARNIKPRVLEKFRDFLYFNDFYILSAVVIAVIVFVIIKE